MKTANSWKSSAETRAQIPENREVLARSQHPFLRTVKCKLITFAYERSAYSSSVLYMNLAYSKVKKTKLLREAPSLEDLYSLSVWKSMKQFCKPLINQPEGR